MDIQDFDYLGKHIILSTTTPPQQQPQQKKPPPLTFFCLPRKVRDCIYDYYFTQSFSNQTDNVATEKGKSDTHDFCCTQRITSASQYNPHIQLLFTARQIHTEACSIFYNSPAHFKSIFFAPELPREAYALIKTLAQYHAESCYGQVRVQPNVHAPTGLSVVSGYRNVIVDDDDEEGFFFGNGGGGYFVSVDFLEFGLGGCDSMMEQVHVLLAAAGSKYQENDNSKGVVNAERYMCGLDWHLRITTPSYQPEESLKEGEGLVLTGYIGVLNCLCSGDRNLPKLKIQVKRKVLKNIGSRFREIS